MNIQFVVIAAVLAVVVLALVLYPVLKHQLKVGLAVLLVCVVSAGALYTQLGTPDALDARLVNQPRSLKDAIYQLETALAKDPGQAEGWALLAQSYRQDGQLVPSRDAFGKAVALQPRNAGLLTDAAESRAMADTQHRFDDKAVAMLQQALAIDANNERARWFMGVAWRQQGRDAEAAETWAPLLSRVEPAAAEALLPQINLAREAAGLPAMTMPAREAASEANALVLNVTIDPALAKDPRWNEASAAFVIARAPGGPPMPIAARKLALSELPAQVRLTDADSPMPTAKLSAVKEVEVFARLSATGSANRGEGDIETAPVRVTLPAKAPIALALKP